jgi:hypothetical protein
MGGATSTALRDLPRDHTCRQQLKILQQQHLRYADAVSYLQHLRPVAIADNRGSDAERYISQQLATLCLAAKPMMQRCSKICHTLPGHIIEAIPGSCRIVTSHDLTFYLCATGNENRYGDHSEPTRASISGMLNGNKSSVLHLKVGTGFAETMCFTIDAIFGREISLDKPYNGPSITASLPKNSIRTNLQLKPPPLSDSIRAVTSVCSSCKVKTEREESSGIFGEHVAQISLPARATAIEPHPCSPFVFVGCLDDSLVVLSAEASRRLAQS